MFSKIFSLTFPSRPADLAWPLCRIDISACAAIWGLPEPVPYTTDPEAVGYDQVFYDELPLDCYSWNRETLWLHPELVRDGGKIARSNGKRQPLLKVYSHEVGHRLAGPGTSHDIEFAAIYAFLLARIPGDWCIDDMMRAYDVHTTCKAITPFRRGAKAQNWQEKTTRYALRIATDWGWELAQDDDLTAPEAMEIIRDWEKDRREGIDRRERIEDRLTFVVCGLVGLVLVGWWIWKMSRPLT